MGIFGPSRRELQSEIARLREQLQEARALRDDAMRLRALTERELREARRVSQSERDRLDAAQQRVTAACHTAGVKIRTPKLLAMVDQLAADIVQLHNKNVELQKGPTQDYVDSLKDLLRKSREEFDKLLKERQSRPIYPDGRLLISMLSARFGVKFNTHLGTVEQWFHHGMDAIAAELQRQVRAVVRSEIVKDLTQAGEDARLKLSAEIADALRKTGMGHWIIEEDDEG